MSWLFRTRRRGGLVLALGLIALACAGPPEPTPAERLRALDDPHWQVRASAAEAFGRDNMREVVPHLIKALGDESGPVRTAAVMSLGRLRATSALKDIETLVREDDSAQVRVQALFTLAALGDESHVDLVVTALDDDSRRVSRAAWRVLWQLVDRKSIIKQIGEDLHSERALVRRAAIARADELDLKKIEGWDQQALLDHRDSRLRAFAYRVIRRDPGHDDLPTLLEGVRDESKTPRRVALEALAKLDDPSVEPELIRVLTTDPSKSVRKSAARRLARLHEYPGDPLLASWHFERIDDRIRLARDGECTLRRTMTVHIDQTVEPIGELEILMPSSFPNVDRLLQADGSEIEFKLDWKGGLREIDFEITPLKSGQAATFTVVAHSRRPLFRGDKHDAWLAYSPAPFQAPVRELHVELVPPGADIRLLDPADGRLAAQGHGEFVSWSRQEISTPDAEGLVLRAAVPMADLELPRTPPKYRTLNGDLGTAFTLVALVLGCLVAVIVHLRRTRGGQADRAILMAVLVAGVFLFLTPILLEDNLSYYATARSAVLDGDLNRVNEFTEFNVNRQYTPDNRAAQDPVFAWMFRVPFVALAHVLTLGLNAFSFHYAANGFSFPYLFVTALGDFLAVAVGCLACFSLVERRVGRRFALFGVLAVVGGTNLLLFTYAWTGSSFQPSFLLFAVFLNYWDKTRDRRSPAGWLGAGVLLGLLGITRVLDLGFGVLPLLDWIFLAIVLLRAGDWRRVTGHVGHGVLFSVGFFAGYAPQLIVQRLVDHTWLVDSYGVGSGRFQGLRDNLWGLMVERGAGDHDGVLLGMPLIGLALIGLLPLIRFDRRLGTLVVVTLGLQIFAIASYEVYWGYFEYGTSYLAPASPIFCLGMAGLARAIHRRSRRLGTALLVLVVGLFSLRNVWCVLRQLADDLIGPWQEDMGVLEVLHVLLVPARKLNIDVLQVSSEFGCLLREATGAVRAVAPGQLLAALFWFSLLLVPLLLAGPAWRHLAGRMSRISPRMRARWVVAGLVIAALTAGGGLIALGSATDLDHNYDDEKGTERAREFKLRRIGPGASYLWEYSLGYACDRFSMITFLEDAASVNQGERVATIEFESRTRRTSFELRAGVDIADFALMRPESREENRHEVPGDRVSFAWRIRDDSDHLYTARAYRTLFEFPSTECKGKLQVTSNLEKGVLSVVMFTSHQSKLPHDPSRRRWLADRW